MKKALLPAIVVLLAFAAYLPVRTASYVQDDHIAVERNPVVERGDLGEIFSTHYWAGIRDDHRYLYRPVTILSYALERGDSRRSSAFTSHAVNLGLHILASWLVLLLARRLGIGPLAAAFAAFLFTVHPVHVEAVAGIVGRAEILATLFTLGALLLYSRADPGSAGPVASRLAAWGAAASLFLALGSKEIALVCLPLLFCMDLLFRKPPRGRAVSWWIERSAALAPALLAFQIHIILRIGALESLFRGQDPHPVDNMLVLLDQPERLLTALGLLARYAGLLAFPIGPGIDYSGEVVSVESSLLSPLPLLGLLLLSVLLVVAVLPWFSRANRSPVEPMPRFHTSPTALRSFTAFLFLFPYLVVGNLLFPVGVTLAERFLYLPSAAFCMALALFLEYLAVRYPAFLHWSDAQRMRYVGVIALVLLTAFLLLAYARATVWQTDESVFRAAAAQGRSGPRCHFILGTIARDRGSSEEALAHFERAIERSSRFEPAFLESGILLAREGRMEEAADRFRRTVVLLPDYPPAHLNLGLALRRLGLDEEAERSVRKALVHDPGHAASWAELGNILASSGRVEEAAGAWRTAIDLGREDLVPRLRKLQAGGG